MKLDYVAWQIDGILSPRLCQVDFLEAFLEARKSMLGMFDQALILELVGHSGRNSSGFSMRGRDHQGALLLPNRSDVQITNRFKPFVRLLDFSNYAKLV